MPDVTAHHSIQHGLYQPAVICAMDRQSLQKEAPDVCWKPKGPWFTKSSVGNYSKGFLSMAVGAEETVTMAKPVPYQLNTSIRHLQSHSFPVSVQLHRIASAASQSRNPALRNFGEPLVLLLPCGRISPVHDRRLRCAPHPQTSTFLSQNTPQTKPGNGLFAVATPRADSGATHPLFSARYTTCSAARAQDSGRKVERAGGGRGDD